MEKRLFLAIFLSVLVLITYSSLVSKLGPQTKLNQPSSGKNIVNTLKTKELRDITKHLPPDQIDGSPLKLSSSSPSFILESEDLVLTIAPDTGAIQKILIKKQEFELPQKNIGAISGFGNMPAEIISVNHLKSMVYKKKNGVEIHKKYEFLEKNFLVRMSLEIINNSSEKSYESFSLNLGTMDLLEIKKNPIDQRYCEFSISLPDKMLRKNFFSFKPPQGKREVDWIGIRDRYFCSIIQPQQSIGEIDRVVDDKKTSFLINYENIEILPGEKLEYIFDMYIGPQKEELIKNLGEDYGGIINFGFFDAVAKALLVVLGVIFGICKNWGVTILIFSIAVFLIMSPLSTKSFSSMKRMQEVQPEVEAIRTKYKDNPQRMNKEMMELYKEKKINPLGGCLPMILQMPIFISLFQLLSRLVDLKGASFLWIKDLAEPDRLFVFSRMSKDFPVIGNELNILPLIMVVTMVLQQRMTSMKQGASGQSAQQQKMMSVFMTVFFFMIFYKMPSSLVLYWSTNSVLMLIFQFRTMRVGSR